MPGITRRAKKENDKLFVEAQTAWDKGDLGRAFELFSCAANSGFRGMPTVLRIGPFRFHFYSDERNELPHIHVRGPDGECKFWLDPISLASVQSLKPHDVRVIERLVFENRELLLSAYHEFRRRR